MPDKLKSRKFWVTIFAAILLVLTDGLGVDIDPATYWSVVSIVSAYVVGQSIVDAKRS